MKNLVAILYVVFTLFSIQYSHAQNQGEFNKLISKEWKLQYIIQEGILMVPDLSQADDLMIFTSDNKVLAVDNCHITSGSWNYDAEKKIMIFTDDFTNNTDVLKVELLEEDYCILTYISEDGSETTVYMRPRNGVLIHN